MYHSRPHYCPVNLTFQPLLFSCDESRPTLVSIRPTLCVPRSFISCNLLHRSLFDFFLSVTVLLWSNWLCVTASDHHSPPLSPTALVVLSTIVKVWLCYFFCDWQGLNKGHRPRLLSLHSTITLSILTFSVLLVFLSFCIYCTWVSELSKLTLDLNLNYEHMKSPREPWA